jgi:hypothetical protein
MQPDNDSKLMTAIELSGHRELAQWMATHPNLTNFLIFRLVPANGLDHSVDRIDSHAKVCYRLGILQRELELRSEEVCLDIAKATRESPQNVSEYLSEAPKMQNRVSDVRFRAIGRSASKSSVLIRSFC